MSDTVPPIPPPFGANIGNPSSPIRAGNPTDTINNTTTTSVVQNVVDENLLQLLDSRGGSHVTNVLEFDKEDFSSWKDMFLVYLDGLKPYLLDILDNRPFVPLSPLSTPTNPLPKSQNQWSHADKRLVNQDKRLKSIFISCLPNDLMKYVIKCTTAKAIWTDLIFAHEGPSETKDIKIAALRLKFNAFKALEGEKVNETFTRLKSSLNDPENNDVSIPQAEESDSDIEEDQRSSSEFLANLNAEFHERTLPANQRRFYKRSGRVGSLKKPMDRVKYKGLKAKNAVLTKKIDAMNKGKSEKGLALMVVADEELSVGRTDARSYQWVEITMQKVQKLLSLTDSDERRHVLDYTHSELNDLNNTKALNLSFQSEITKLSLEKELLGNIVKYCWQITKYAGR
ncbi:hypothetical protein Tco_1373000 [Tanacetum coccineum]